MMSTELGKTLMKENSQFSRFDRTMRDLISVPHDEIKAALDEEKAHKQRKKRKSKKPSASGRADGKTD